MRINKQSPPLFLSCYLINLFLFLNSSNLSPTPSRVAPRNIFCTSEIKSQSSHPLLFFCLHFTQQRDNTPTCDKSTHIHQTSLKSASNRKQKDDSFIREWAREHRSLAECLSSERASERCGMETYRLRMDLWIRPLICTTCSSCFALHKEFYRCVRYVLSFAGFPILIYKIN